MNTQSPYEQMKFIRDVIKDRTDKSQATFFSVKLESFGNLTPLVEKENGALFYDTIIQYLTRYDVSAIIVELYHGKSHNIKEPFQTFKIVIKRSPNVSLSGIEKKDETLTVHTENIISPEKHFQTLAENQFNLLRLQYENDVLRKKNKKKKNYIQELEVTIEKMEREKKGGLGNVALGSVASNALESFAKSNFGIAILKNVFGAKDEVLQGLVGNTTDYTQAEEANSKAEVIKEEKPLSENEKVRKQIIESLTDFLKGADDGVLRLYYELFQLIGSDIKILQSLFMQMKKYRGANPNQNTVVPIKDELGGKKEEKEKIDDS